MKSSKGFHHELPVFLYIGRPLDQKPETKDTVSPACTFRHFAARLIDPRGHTTQPIMFELRKATPPQWL